MSKSQGSKGGAVQLPASETLNIDQIIPYWRNPRRLGQETVNAIAESIRRYGYQQPIVVDEERVIIIGHTRYAALRRLEVTEVPVLVARGLDADKIKQLRIIDNKSAEFTLWDFDKLQEELSTLDQSSMAAFFNELEQAAGGPGIVEDSDELPGAGLGEGEELMVDFVCPSCFHSFEKHVTRDQIMAGKVE